MNKFHPRDCTIIVPTVDAGPELSDALFSWLRNHPARIIFVTCDSEAEKMNALLRSIEAQFKSSLPKDSKVSVEITTASVPKPNKRVQMVAGLKLVETELVLLVDDDAVWPDTLLEETCKAFEDPTIGGVGTEQRMRPCNMKDGGIPTMWEVFADFRLTAKTMENACAIVLGNAVTCLSGRTAAYRTCIFKPSLQHGPGNPHSNCLFGFREDGFHKNNFKDYAKMRADPRSMITVDRLLENGQRKVEIPPPLSSVSTDVSGQSTPNQLAQNTPITAVSNTLADGEEGLTSVIVTIVGSHDFTFPGFNETMAELPQMNNNAFKLPPSVTNNDGFGQTTPDRSTPENTSDEDEKVFEIKAQPPPRPPRPSAAAAAFPGMVESPSVSHYNSEGSSEGETMDRADEKVHELPMRGLPYSPALSRESSNGGHRPLPPLPPGAAASAAAASAMSGPSSSSSAAAVGPASLLNVVAPAPAAAPLSSSAAGAAAAAPQLPPRIVTHTAATTARRSRDQVVDQPLCEYLFLAFTHAFLRDFWRGKYLLQSGDDKFLTRWLVVRGWRMYTLIGPKACVMSTFKPNWRFLKQYLRWTRNTWRSDFRSVFVERAVWKSPRDYLILVLIMVDKMVSPFTLLAGPVLVGLLVGFSAQCAGGLGPNGLSWLTILCSYLVWLPLSRAIRIFPHFISRFSHIIYIPAFVLLQYLLAVMKIYCLFTLNVTAWGTRNTGNEVETLEEIQERRAVERQERDELARAAERQKEGCWAWALG